MRRRHNHGGVYETRSTRGDGGCRHRHVGSVRRHGCRRGPPLSYDDDIISQFDATNSLETVRHLAVDIGPRRSGLPEEDEAAEYLAAELRTDTASRPQVYQYPFAGNASRGQGHARRTRRSINGPNWQLSFAANSKITGNDTPVTGDGHLGQQRRCSATDFPAATAGKIVMMQPGAPRPRRATRRSSTRSPRAPSA